MSDLLTRVLGAIDVDWDELNDREQKALTDVLARDALAAELERVKAALVAVGCIDKHFCGASDIALPYEDDDGIEHTWPLCIRCAALAAAEGTE